jgi:polar amino acid transport system substrate-binding protein
MGFSRRLWLGAAPAAAVGAAALLRPAAAEAQVAAGSTIDNVVKRGTLQVGVSLGTPPFGITNASMEPDGYDVNIAKLLAQQLGVKIAIVDIVAANRIPSLTTGKVDLVISSFSITPERAKAIAFSNAVYVDQQVAIGPKAVDMPTVASLAGKRIGVTRSTTNDIALTKQALLAGQVQGIVTSGALAAAIRGRSPALALETKFVVSEAPMAAGLRRDDLEWLHWVNTTLFMLWTNKQIQPLQQQWMGVVNQDLPRFG